MRQIWAPVTEFTVASTLWYEAACLNADNRKAAASYILTDHGFYNFPPTRKTIGERKTMVNYLELPIGDKSPEVFRAVIEIPLEGINKYEYDKELHVFRLDRNLYSPVHYPGDYGFIPSTLSDDGDPLDVLVLVDTPSFCGCIQEVRPIGLLEMLDQGVLDEKVLAVGKNNPRYSDVWNYSDIYPHILKEITHFFAIYKDLEGKRVEIKGWHDASYARDHVVRSAKQFEENKLKKATKA
jgi:inorganic pyrophosphatase